MNSSLHIAESDENFLQTTASWKKYVTDAVFTADFKSHEAFLLATLVCQNNAPKHRLRLSLF